MNLEGFLEINRHRWSSSGVPPPYRDHLLQVNMKLVVSIYPSANTQGYSTTDKEIILWNPAFYS